MGLEKGVFVKWKKKITHSNSAYSRKYCVALPEMGTKEEKLTISRRGNKRDIGIEMLRIN